MKVTITDWKVLIEIIWELELWYSNNYRKLSNKHRRKFRILLDEQTAIMKTMKDRGASA